MYRSYACPDGVKGPWRARLYLLKRAGDKGAASISLGLRTFTTLNLTDTIHDTRALITTDELARLLL